MVRATFTRPTSGTPEATGGAVWTTLGSAGSVSPGALAAFQTEAGAVAVANVAGTYYAVDAACTHRHCSLAEGDLDGTVVTCICHGSQFDVTSGAVRRGPAQAPVRSYPVRVEGTDIQIRT